MTRPDAKTLNDATPWVFVLYTTKASAAGQRAKNVLQRLCDRYLRDRSTIRIVDLEKETDNVPPDILILPTTVRVSPLPERRIIGDLSDREAAIRGLGLETGP